MQEGAARKMAAAAAGLAIVVRLPVTADARAFRREALVDE